MMQMEVGIILGQVSFIVSSADILAKSRGRPFSKVRDSEGIEALIKETKKCVASLRAVGATNVADVGNRYLGAMNAGNEDAAIIADRLLAFSGRIKEFLDAQVFLFIPTEQRYLYEKNMLDGTSLTTAFRDAEEAGKCLALDRPTASVFHSMRVAEHGLRALAKKLRVSLRDKGKSQPIEYADWNKVITAIKNKIASARSRPHGKDRAESLELYSNAADHCEYMKDIWRNDVCHTRKIYSNPEALGVIQRVKAFMMLLEKLNAKTRKQNPHPAAGG